MVLFLALATPPGKVRTSVLFLAISHDICKDQAHVSISTLESHKKQHYAYACFCIQIVIPKVKSKEKKKKGGVALFKFLSFHLSAKIVLILKVPIHFLKSKLPSMYHT